jgi:uncharacterized membrane protein YidH (DUF202 family)
MIDDHPPATAFDPGLQSERTALAWERTAFSMMVAGILFARYAVTDAHIVLAGAGLVQLLLGAVLLVWAGFRYDQMQAPLRANQSIVHPAAARLVGLTSIGFTALALALALVVVIQR